MHRGELRWPRGRGRRLGSYRSVQEARICVEVPLVSKKLCVIKRSVSVCFSG